MRPIARWCVASTGSAAALAASWLVCAQLAGLDTATSVAVASAVLVVVGPFLCWWAAREQGRPGPAATITQAASLAQATGQAGQAIAGSPGMVIGGTADLRGATFHLGNGGEQPLDQGSATNQDRAADPAVVGDVLQQPPAFQPRNDLLDLLRGESAQRGVCVVHAVTGMCGTGKTQAAAAYARERIAAKWRLVTWVNAESTSTMLDGLAATATALSIAPCDDLDATAKAVRNRLEADGDRCLIVFDNANDPAQLRPYLPAAGAAQVIITSTRKAMTDLGTSVPVDVFNESEAMAYLAQRTGHQDAADAREVAAELGYLPLALAQAAAVIKTQLIDFRTYLARLRKVPTAQYLTRPEADPYPHGTAEAILLSLESALTTDTTGLAAPVMDLVALLSPAGVPRDLLYAAPYATAPGTGIQIHDSTGADIDALLAQLAAASLLTFSIDGTTISANRLVMRVIREQRRHDGTLAAAGRTAIALLLSMSQELDPVWQHPQAARDFIQQVTALHDHFTALLPGSGIIDSEELLNLREWTLYCINELGDNPSLAVSVGLPLTEDHERVHGADHPDTLTSRNNLALAYQDAGRHSEAIPLHEQTLGDRKRILGADHPATLTSRNNLALGYQAAGRHSEAIPLHEQTLADRERILGADHPATLNSRNNLAGAYHDAGRLSEAIPLYERALAGCQPVLGNDHPLTQQVRANLRAAQAESSSGRMQA